jgi:hypothetical protein
MANSEAIAVILQRICTSLLQCHGSHPSRSSIPAVYRTITAGWRASCWWIMSRLLSIAAKVGACLIDLAQVERVFGVVGMPRILPAFG